MRVLRVASCGLWIATHAPTVLPLTTLTILASAAAAEETSAPADLYQAKAIVTGRGEKNRQIGFALALEDVLVKVSGDSRLIGDPRAKKLAEQVGALVAEFHYRDRLEGIPIHDEQGSYDRPHDLTVRFPPAKIDAALRSLGSKPWTAPRPTITLFLGVANGDRTFVLSSDGERGADMRDSLSAASERIGIPATLPDTASLAAAGLTVETLPTAGLPILAEVAMTYGGAYALVGRLVWSDAALGWIADWSMVEGGKSYRWQIRGVSFDDAFRNGLRGIAQVLSGNGEPD